MTSAVADVFTKECTYCCEKINDVGIKCCSCDGFHLCLECFSVGAEIGQHRKTHPYRITNWASFTSLMPDSDWKVSDEHCLLRNLAVLNYGNWTKLQKYMNDRTAEELKEHYDGIYVEGAIGESTWGVATRPEIKGDPVKTNDPKVDIQPKESEYLNYNSKIDYYNRKKECTFDIEAEMLLCSLLLLDNFETNVEKRENGDIYGDTNQKMKCDNFKPEDFVESKSTYNDDLKDNVKLALVNMYMRRLRERCRQQYIIRDYQLFAKYFATDRAQKSNDQIPIPDRYTVELIDQLNVFSQFNCETVHSDLIKNLKKEHDLRQRLNTLQTLHDKGFNYLRECKNGKYDFNDLKNMLTNQEKNICETLNISTTEYVTLKLRIMKDSTVPNNAQENLNRSQSNTVNYEAVKLVTDYLVSTGLIKSKR